MYQQKVWDSIAEQWFHFRQMKFPVVYEFFEKYCKNKKGKVLDIGCGNARNILPFAKAGLECYGIDFSSEMINYANEYCKKHNIKCILKKADMRELPFKDNFFDICIMPSSLHQLENNSGKALEEMHRVLKKGGIALVTVWNKWNREFLFKKKELLIPWRIKGKNYNRYYRLYNHLELKKMLRKSGFQILKSKPFDRNLTFVIMK